MKLHVVVCSPPLVSIAAFLLVGLIACDNSDNSENDSKITGSGVYTYTDYLPFADKPIDCYYYVPAGSNNSTPVFVVVHGAGRDAKSLRDGLITMADQKKFIVLSPQFSATYFPGSDAFNMANIFEDGDDPTPATLNPESEWTFSVLDPLFEDFKVLTGNSRATYDVFGHSAGAQMIHRFLIFQPEAKFNRVVCSAAGWYAVPDSQVDYPYGLRLSPAETQDPQPYFGRTAYIIVGENDTDPNSFNLRHTPEADLQGLNRLQRAQYFYQESFDRAHEGGHNYQWQYRSVPNAGHNSDAMAAFAADLLY